MTDSGWGADVDLWRTVAAPFTPSPADLALFGSLSPRGLLLADAAPRILVLGVTPALVDAPWPQRSEVHAVDYDQAMIALLWTPREGAHVHLARWQEMPLPDAYFDLIVGDCSFNALPDIAEYPAVLRQLARVRKPGAPLITRFFVRPDPALSLTRLPQMAAAEFAGFSAAAMRLLVLIASADDEGRVRTPNIPGQIRDRWGDVGQFLVALGQSPAEIERLASLYGLEQRLNVPAEHDIRRQFEPFFSDIRFQFPDYDVGRYCPIVRFD